MIKRERTYSYKAIYLHNDRRGDYERVLAWANGRRGDRLRSRTRSFSDAVLDVVVGYLDVLDARDTPLALEFRGDLDKARQLGGTI